MEAKEWFPPDPFPRKPKENPVLLPPERMVFPEGAWGNRSLDTKSGSPRVLLSYRSVSINALFQITAVFMGADLQ